MHLFVCMRNYSNFFAVTCSVALALLWPFMILLANYNVFTSENLERHLFYVLFDQFFLQASAVFLTTFIIVTPIYIFKFVKMRLVYPHFFPENQSTYSKTS